MTDSGRGKPSALRLAVRHGARSRAQGAGWVLLLALVVAVAAVTAVNQLTDRVRAGMTRQGAATLAADLRLDLRAPLSAARARQIDAAGVRRAAVTVFPSVISRGDSVTLISVKAVTCGYPLRGALTLRRGPPGTARVEVAHGPPAGTVWVDQRVLDEQDIAIGDALTLGDKRFTVGAALVIEPDRAPGFANIAPRVLMPASDLAATGLLGPGSRARYAELLAGPPDAIAALRTQLAPSLGVGERLRTPAESNRALSRALERADVFLDLAALVAVVLAGVAIALTARQHAAARMDEIALLKTLGAARGLIARILAWQLALIGALGVALGVALGGAAQAGIGLIVARAFAIELPGASWASLWVAPAAGVVLLAGFAWPALAAARGAAPARVLARSLAADSTRGWLVYVGAIIASVAMAAAATRDLGLTLWVVAAAAGATLGLVLAALGLLRLVALAHARLGARAGPGLRLGLAALGRRRGAAVLQIVAFGIGLTLLFMLVIVRGDLLAGWQADIAADAPNRFLINITPEQRPGIADYLHEHGIDAVFHPLVRGRLTRVDGKSITADPARKKAAGELVRRALNLSWSDSLKADNHIVAGRWFGAADRGTKTISIARSVADRLDAGVGDTLTFDIAGRTLTANIESIRAIDWSSLQANFYVLFPPGTLDGFAATYITSFYLDADAHRVLANLVQRYANVSVIDIAAILDQIERLIGRVSLAVELVFGFTLAAGVVVLVAAMQASLGQRQREAALLRALGARSGSLVRATLIECALIGGCASVLAAVVAQIAAVVLATQVLDLDYAWRTHLWLAAVVIATLTITLAGSASLASVFRQPAWRSLRATENE